MLRLMNQVPNLRILYEGDKGDGSGAGGQSSGDDLISIKDPETGEDVQVPKRYENLLNHMVSGTRKNVKRQTKEEYTGLLSKAEERLREKEKENSDILSQFDELKQSTMTVEEKAREQVKTKLNEFQKKVELATSETEKWKGLFMKDKIYNDVYKSFGDIDLCNREQTATLFINEGRAEVREKLTDTGEATGDYETVLSISITDKDGNSETLTGLPTELFSKWVNQSKNHHHISNNLIPGGGSHSSKRRDLSGIDMSKMSPTEKLKLARSQK